MHLSFIFPTIYIVQLYELTFITFLCNNDVFYSILITLFYTVFIHFSWHTFMHLDVQKKEKFCTIFFFKYEIIHLLFL